MILWLILSLLLATVPGLVQATTRYVHGTSGSDTANSCSASTSSNPSSAKRTIMAGIGCMSGGDELIVRGGTGGNCINYKEHITGIPSGSSSAYTIMRTQDGECARIRPSPPATVNGDAGPDALHEVITFDTHSYIILDGFKLDGGDESSEMISHSARRTSTVVEIGNDDSTHHIIVRNNEMSRSLGICLGGEGTNITAENNLVHHCGFFCCDSGRDPPFVDPETGRTSHGDSHGFYWRMHNGIVRGNTFHHNPAYSIQIYGAETNDMSNNIVENNSFSLSRCGITWKGNNNIIRNNIMFNDGHNEDLGVYSGVGCEHSGSDVTTHVGIIDDGSSSKILNNTLYKHTIHDHNGNCGSGCQMKNNISCEAEGLSNVTGSGDITNNLLGSCPGVVNAGAGNLHLTSDDTGGVTNSLALVDKDGNTRRTPNSSRGAYDFGGAPGPSVATALHFLTQPSTAVVNTAITPAVQVDILDQFGAHMNSASATISLTLTAGSGTVANGGPTATVSGTASFPTLTVSGAGTGHILTATATGSGLTSATSVPFTVTGVPTACTSPCTIYVNPTTGDDSRACNAVTLGNARQTLAGGLACMTVGGSTLYLRAGTYNDCIDTSVTPIASGSTGAPTTIAAYTNEVVTLAPTVAATTACQAVVFLRNSEHDMIFSGLIIDAGNRTDSNGFVFYPGAHHVRLQNSIVRNTFYEGVLMSDASDTVVADSTIEQSAFFGVNVTNSSTRTLLDNLIIRNHARNAIRIINGSIFTVNRVTATANGVSGAVPAIRVGAAGNSGSLIANSVVTGNYAGIEVTSGASGLKVYNNTVANNTNAGVTIGATATGTLVTNTIMTGHGGGLNLVDSGTGTVQTSVLFTNPGFDGGASCPYCLTPAATTAVNVGTSLAADVPLDRAGVTRPQGIGYDIGAYECPEPCTGIVPPPTGVQLKTPAWQTGGLYRK